MALPPGVAPCIPAAPPTQAESEAGPGDPEPFCKPLSLPHTRDLCSTPTRARARNIQLCSGSSQAGERFTGEDTTQEAAVPRGGHSDPSPKPRVIPRAHPWDCVGQCAGPPGAQGLCWADC